jgi:hypothetical protein
MVPEALPLLKPKSFHAHHAHVLAFGKGGFSDAVQEGVGADEQAQLAGEPRAGLAAQGEGYPLQGLLPAVGAPGIDAGDVLQALGEDLALASRFVAEELADSHPQAHRHPAPW